MENCIMPYTPRKSKPFDLAEAQRLRDLHVSYRAIAAQLGTNYAAVWRALNTASTNGHPTASAHTDSAPTLPQRMEVVGEPDSAEPVQSSAEQLSDHETRLQVLESFVASLQARALQPSMPHITVQSSADSAYALHSAESVQTWDDPEDAKPERWNLWLPRGLKRRIEAHAKAAGIAPSQLVQRLLMAALPRPEGER
jgi:hypothetical protein